MKRQNQIKLTCFTPEDGFINRIQKLIKDVVIPYQYEVLSDSSEENSEKSHVIQNFINAGTYLASKDPGDGYYGMVFQDSDAAKWLEAVAYALVVFPDRALEEKADSLIDIIEKAQDSDGYLNTYYTVKDQEKRWTNLCEGHELYCSGHMMEAACAYYEATGKRRLLDVMERNMEHIYKVFMDSSKENFNGYPGHPEVELALLRMYSITGNPHALELAQHFIDVRGKDPEYFEKESAGRGWTVWGNTGNDHTYAQNDRPVRELNDATGHAVRAVYLYTAMADLASRIQDKELLDACQRLWNSITCKRMYVTGGIGSTGNGEAFTVDYDLPSDTSYCETCASIGLMFFASRMLKNDVDRKYSDVMEKAFYNTVLAGMQLDGKKFFYVNPLEVVPGIANVANTHRHVIPQRPTWYACACCPPNVARLVSSFGKYAFGENDDTAFIHLYAQGKASFENGIKIECKTDYPYGFTVSIEVKEARIGDKVAVRIPSWSKNYSISKNGEPVEVEPVKGYAYLEVSAGDCLLLTLDENPYFIYPSPRIPDLSGMVAVARGPLVYCAEGVDNKDDVLSLGIDTSEKIWINAAEKENAVAATLSVRGYRLKACEELYSTEKPESSMENIKMIPYYTWGNRGLNQMRVWLPSKN